MSRSRACPRSAPASLPTPKPSYSDTQIVASFAGPLRIPHVLKNGPNMFLGYQRTIDTNASTQSIISP